jgi:hypothetical protein
MGVLQIGIRAIKQNGVLVWYQLNKVAEKGVLQIGIRAKVSTLSLDGPVERSLDRECEGKLGLEGQFRTLVYSKMSRSYLTSF